MPDAQPLEPTDIWTADGRKVSVQRRSALPFGLPTGLPFGLPVEALGAVALAPVALGVLAAGAAVATGAVAFGVASAAARSLLGGGPAPFVVGVRLGDDDVEVLVVRTDVQPPQGVRWSSAR